MQTGIISQISFWEEDIVNTLNFNTRWLPEVTLNCINSTTLQIWCAGTSQNNADFQRWCCTFSGTLWAFSVQVDWPATRQQKLWNDVGSNSSLAKSRLLTKLGLMPTLSAAWNANSRFLFCKNKTKVQKDYQCMILEFYFVSGANNKFK